MEIQWSFFVNMLYTIGSGLYSRAVEHGDNLGKYELPNWAVLVVLANFVVFLPFVVVIQYTLKQIYPVFAIIEDENPPAYEPVSLNDDAASLAEPSVAGSKPTHGRAQTVTSSLLSVNRLLRANGGMRAYFRGLACYIAQSCFNLFLMGIFTAVLGTGATPVATLLAALSLVQYSTAWVHIVVSQRSPLHFWRRLPPFKRTFDATWKPVTLFWAATELNRWVPDIVSPILGLHLPKLSYNDSPEIEPAQPGEVWKVLVILAVSMVVSILAVMPAHVILVRVQASLLPEDVDTIIPFDRSFEGKVEPAVVSGRGHATISDAWSTFSRAAWRRLIVLYVKIYATTIISVALLMAVLVPQILLIGQHSNQIGDDGDL